MTAKTLGGRTVDPYPPSVTDVLIALNGLSLEAWFSRYPSLKIRCDEQTAEGALRERARRAANP